MAFPTVDASNTSSESVAKTSHTVNLPACIEEGNLLVVFFCVTAVPDDLVTTTFPCGWNLIHEEINGKTSSVHAYYRDADGLEGSTITVTTDQNGRTIHTSLLITGHLITAHEGAGAKGTSADPNSPNLIPTGGSKDYLWFSTFIKRTLTAVTLPTNYTNEITHTFNEGTQGTGSRNLTASSENPPAWTVPTSASWSAVTVAIHPAISDLNIVGNNITPKLIAAGII